MPLQMTAYNYDRGRIQKGHGLSPDELGIAFHQTVTQTGIGNSDYVLIPDHASQILCVLDPNGNTAKLQATVGSVDDINNNSAIWEDWDHGETISTKSCIYGPVTAIRIVVITGVSVSKAQLRAPMM